MFVMKVKVVGVNFKNEDDGSSRQKRLCALYDDFWTEPGKPDEIKVELRREPDNRFDPKAVGVWVVEPEAHAGRVGFVGADQNVFVGAAIEEGSLAAVEVEDMKVAGRGSRVSMTLSVKVREGDDADGPEEGPPAEIEDEEGRTYEFG